MIAAAGNVTGSMRETNMKPAVHENIYDLDALKLAVISITNGKHFGNIMVKF